ncbi:hypothetical protein JCM24511_00819 [Saitozyma sp. JCM 24511]|nr:hypothetical protein JCM24511_00819 [Saitozyma sp. JCM 24511]
MSSSETPSPDSGPRYMRSGDLYLFPSFDDVYMTVSEFQDGEDYDFIHGFLMPMSNEISSVYLTSRLDDPRSFVWVTKNCSGDGSEPGVSGRCYKLDVRGPPFFDDPSATRLDIEIGPEWSETSIVKAFDEIERSVHVRPSDLSPEMRKLMEDIKTNEKWIARTVALKADEHDTSARLDASEAMSEAETVVE